MHSIDDLWGCARGPILRAAPHVRVIAAALVFAACLTCSGATIAGSLCAVGICLAWLAACRPPRRILLASLALGAALFLPYFLLLPLIPVELSPSEGEWGAVSVLWTILLRGLSGMLVSVATVTSFSTTELSEALVRLPVPWIVSSILLQIVQQVGILVHETRRVAAAMAVRGSASGGRVAWRVLFSLPQVWLPRVMDRAERVGAAMELRGYGQTIIALERRGPLGRPDHLALLAASGALVMAVGVRMWSAA